MYSAVGMVLLHAAAAMFFGWLYFRRYAIGRPPIGVMSLGDIAIMMAGIILVPVLYVLLPRWLVLVLIGSAAVSVVYFLWEPVLRKPWSWLLTLVLIGADIVLAWQYGSLSLPFIVVNNIVLIMMTVGITNLWAQSGMRAREIVVLGVALMVYDYIATWYFSLMGDMFSRLSTLPLVPIFVWRVSATQWAGIGLGDVLLATVFPLVMRKAYGRQAGIVALLLGLVALVAIMGGILIGEAAIFPAMLVLGPLMVAQYLLWRRRSAERTTWQYLEAEPLPGGTR